MSIHSSLRAAGGKIGAFRNVLKRHERIRTMMTQARWTDGQSVFGLPKIKAERRKIRKGGGGGGKEAAEKTAEPAAPAK